MLCVLQRSDGVTKIDTLGTIAIALIMHTLSLKDTTPANGILWFIRAHIGEKDRAPLGIVDGLLARLLSRRSTSWVREIELHHT